MDADRIHRALSDGGTQIAGRVQGHGPPIDLVHGGLGDGEPAGVFGHSSGAALVLGGAALAAHFRGIALYESPFTP